MSAWLHWSGKREQRRVIALQPMNVCKALLGIVTGIPVWRIHERWRTGD